MDPNSSDSDVDSLEAQLQAAFDGASDEEEEAAAAVAAMIMLQHSESSETIAPRRGRLPGSKTVVRRACSWYSDYLSDNPRYGGYKFREVFRIPIKLYHVLLNRLTAEHPTLAQQVDALGRPGHSSHQKLLSSLRRLGLPASYRERDDSSCMSPESQRMHFRTFVLGMDASFGSRYLNREPSLEELRRITSEYEEEGFPGCRGSLDCMHLAWKNCPLELKGQFHNPKNGKLATISCEAIVDHGLYCWNWFSGRAGTNNDLSVLRNSPFFTELLQGRRAARLPEGYTINGIHRDWLLYFLADGIYGDWAIFVKPIHSPENLKESLLTERQESTRKDVERFNGCLQGRFKILRHESFEFDASFIVSISNCCVILHNMLAELGLSGELEDEYDCAGNRIRDEGILEEFMLAPDSTGFSAPVPSVTPTVPAQWSLSGVVSGFMSVYDQIIDLDAHIELRKALAEHQWSLR